MTELLEGPDLDEDRASSIEARLGTPCFSPGDQESKQKTRLSRVCIISAHSSYLIYSDSSHRISPLTKRPKSSTINHYIHLMHFLIPSPSLLHPRNPTHKSITTTLQRILYQKIPPTPKTNQSLPNCMAWTVRLYFSTDELTYLLFNLM